MIRSRIFRVGFACLVLFGSVALGAFAVSAQERPNSEASSIPRCAPLDAMRQQLEKRYGETLRGVGILNENVAINLYASERGTFTVLLITTSGTACIQHVGKNFSLRSKPVAGSDA